jgi:hypothetical protein
MFTPFERMVEVRWSRAMRLLVNYSDQGESLRRYFFKPFHNQNMAFSRRSHGERMNVWVSHADEAIHCSCIAT